MALKDPSFKILNILQITVFGLILLYLGKKLLIPLSFALLVSLILYPMCHWLEEKGWPKIGSIAISLTLFAFIISGLVVLLIFQFSQFLSKWPQMSPKLEALIKTIMSDISSTLGMSGAEQQDWVNSLLASGLEYMVNWLPKSLYTTSINLILLLLVPFYAILILYYRSNLIEFLHRITQQWSVSNLELILRNSIHTYFKFIRGMVFVYLIVGILNSLGLALLGIPNAILFGFIASILTFIPYVGITIGALLPMTVAWLTYESVLFPLGVVGVFTLVQILEANVIFPLVLSRHLKINALAAIVVIVAGGIIWGVSGMILFLPMVAILRLILVMTDENHPVAILLRP